jgi:flavin reductase (DIM6/NTAB) family NADH-FMN oxidoreductase RutF
VPQTVHRIGADMDVLARAEQDGRVAAATDSLTPLAFKPPTVGQCSISEIATWRLLFQPR